MRRRRRDSNAEDAPTNFLKAITNTTIAAAIVVV
jgi:hypothetical protein